MHCFPWRPAPWNKQETQTCTVGDWAFVEDIRYWQDNQWVIERVVLWLGISTNESNTQTFTPMKL